jgi:demethoxyubiquinone hydroxylase (CLK1/Coq7/Cat5 family)
LKLPKLRAGQYESLDDAPSETVDHNLVFHRMTPFDALKIAEGAERRAQAFFEQIATSAEDSDLRSFARDMAREEAQHVAWITKQLSRMPRPLGGRTTELSDSRG